MSDGHTHYQDYRDVRGDGRIILYRRSDVRNKNWTVRLKVPGSSGYVVRSAKTPDDFEARRFAEDLFYKLEGRSRRGEAIRCPTFKRVFEEWRSSLSADSIRSPSYVQGNLRIMELRAVPYFHQLPIEALDDAAMSKYMDWRINQQKRKPALSTLRNERTVLNQIFRFAKRRGYIRDAPLLRLPSAKIVARPDIPNAEWRKLYTHLRTYVKNAQDKRRYRERFYLQHYILILGNSGIRVGEARHLRWRDISSTKTIAGEKRLIFTVRGKTGEREVVCNQRVEDYVDRLRAFRLEESKRVDLDERVFCHKNGTAIGSFKKGFQQALKSAGVLYGSDGKRRVPYSLRHTYATMRISEGVLACPQLRYQLES